MPDIVTTSTAREGLRGLRRPPINTRPVCAAGRADRSASGPYATHYTATASWLYINRESGEDQFGPVPDRYLDRGDLIASGRCHPVQKTAPQYRDGDLIWREADEAAAREGPTAVSAIHIVADLPEGTRESWEWLIRDFCFDHLVALGMVVDWAVHAKADSAGQWTTRPHAHLLCTARVWRQNVRHGQRQRQWLAGAAQIRAVEEGWLRLLGAGTPIPAAA